MLKKESEKRIEKKLKAEIEKLGGKCIKLATLHESGLPDRICLLPMNRVYFVETKSTGDRLRRIQCLAHHRLEKIGFDVYVIDSTTRLKAFIQYLKN